MIIKRQNNKYLPESTLSLIVDKNNMKRMLAILHQTKGNFTAPLLYKTPKSINISHISLTLSQNLHQPKLPNTKKMSQITDKIRASATEIHYGDEICQEKSKLLLSEVGLPNGLLPLKDIVECGYVKDTGFVWMIQKQKCEHRFEKLGGKLVRYGTEVTAYVEPKKIKKLTGVKSKELLLWITLSDITVDDLPPGKITFKTPTGLFRSFPTSAFELDEVKEEAKDGEKDDGEVMEKENKVKVAVVAPVEVKEVM